MGKAKNMELKEDLEQISKRMDDLHQMFQSTERTIKDTRDLILDDIDYNPHRNQGIRTFTLVESIFVQAGVRIEEIKKDMMRVAEK